MPCLTVAAVHAPWPAKYNKMRRNLRFLVREREVSLFYAFVPHSLASKLLCTRVHIYCKVSKDLTKQPLQESFENG